MHELSLAEALIQQIDEIFQKENAERVLQVTVRVGVMSGVEKDAMEFAFPIAAEETCAEGAKLVIEQVSARVRCSECGAEEESKSYFMECPKCSSKSTELVSGREFELKTLEII